jgi:hypothetical protein
MLLWQQRKRAASIVVPFLHYCSAVDSGNMLLLSLVSSFNVFVGASSMLQPQSDTVHLLDFYIVYMWT